MDEKALAWAIRLLSNTYNDTINCDNCPYTKECDWAGCVIDEAKEWAERILSK